MIVHLMTLSQEKDESLKYFFNRFNFKKIQVINSSNLLAVIALHQAFH